MYSNSQLQHSLSSIAPVVLGANGMPVSCAIPLYNIAGHSNDSNYIECGELNGNHFIQLTHHRLLANTALLSVTKHNTS